MAGDAGEVKVKLTLDSNASEVTGRVKSGLEGVHGASSRLGAAMKGDVGGKFSGALGTAATLAGGALAAGVAAAAAGVGVLALGTHKAISAFEEEDTALRSIAGALSLVDEGGASFEQVFRYADDVKDSLEQIAIKAGEADSAVISAFNDIISRGGKTVEQATKVAETMAMAGKAIPGGTGALADAFEQINMGMIRGKNPIAGMISSMGLLKGNAKGVATQMMAMTPEKRIELAEKAMAKLAEKMKDAPMTMAQMKNGIDTMMTNVWNAAGKGIVKGLGPAFEQVRKFLFDNQEEMQAFAAVIGDNIGKFLSVAAPVLGEVFKVIKESAQEIAKSFAEWHGPTKELFSYLYENKGAFASTIGSVLKDIITVGREFFGIITSVYGLILSALKAIAKSGVLGGDIATGITDIEQASMRQGLKGEINKAGGKSISEDEYQKRRAAFVGTAEGTPGASTAGAEFDAYYRSEFDKHQKTMTSVQDAQGAALDENAQAFAAAWDQAQKTGDEGAKNYVASFLKENTSLAMVLGKAGPEIFKTGIDSFIDQVKSIGGMDDQLAALKKAAAPTIGKKAGAVVNFNGNTFNIKQDFRDQDPDRVAIAFQGDMARAATSRLQSRLASPFGF